MRSKNNYCLMYAAGQYIPSNNIFLQADILLIDLIPFYSTTSFLKHLQQNDRNIKIIESQLLIFNVTLKRCCTNLNCIYDEFFTIEFLTLFSPVRELKCFDILRQISLALYFLFVSLLFPNLHTLW